MLPEMDVAGQKRLMNSSVLIIGMGGLGCPASMYLAAAGIGHITLADDDVIEVTNLQRQIAHSHSKLGEPKVQSAKQVLHGLNKDVEVTIVQERLEGVRLDKAICGGQDGVFLASMISAFFKKLEWIKFQHGDAKTSNFFVNKTLVAIDLDISKKSNLDFLFKNKLSRDKRRMLKSLEGYNDIYSKISKRFRRN